MQIIKDILRILLGVLYYFGASHNISIYRDLPHTLTVSADPHHARVLIVRVEQRDVFEKIDAHILHTRKDGSYK